MVGRTWIPVSGLAFLFLAGAAVGAEKAAVRAPGIWTPEGPAPILFGQVEGITDRPQLGAVHALAPHPTNPDILYVGTVNGGIWRTLNATAAKPSWTPLTDQDQGLSIGDLAFDPTDGTAQTLLAGLGRFSAYAREGGSRSGLLRTTDGGATWTPIGGTMIGRNVSAVVARGSILLAAVDLSTPFACTNIGVFRSTNTGTTWAQVGGGLPAGTVDALAEDPSNNAVLYASVVFANPCAGVTNGIFRSADTGATWARVSTPAMDALLIDSLNSHVELAVGNANNVFAAIVSGNTGQLTGVFRSANGGTTWTAMSVPTTSEPNAFGIHPGGQGDIHTSLVADPSSSTLVYIGGDRQPAPNNDLGNIALGNSIGATDFTGRLFVGDSTLPMGNQWTPLTHAGTAGNSAPHADSRDLAFDAAGTLLEADDGGVYRRTTPFGSAGDWQSMNGDLQVTEVHSLAIDPIAGVLRIGSQDTGTSEQIAPGSTTFGAILLGDGGDAAVDPVSVPGLSIRYGSSQNLGSAERASYDAGNNFQGLSLLQLRVVNGPTLVPQFTTPIQLHSFMTARLVIGAANGVYESFDQGDTLSMAGVGIMTQALGRDTIAYGALDNPDVIWVGGCVGDTFLPCNNINGPDGVFVRSFIGAPFILVFPQTPGDFINAVVIDPANSMTAFIIQSTQVLMTTNGGGVWTLINGNLPPGTGNFRTLEFIQHVDPALVLGTDRGVYLSRASNGFGVWGALGGGLPNAPVFELDYDFNRDMLAAATLGRGTFTLVPVVNQPPFAVPDTAVTNEQVTVAIPVTTNDSDPDGFINPSTVRVTTAPGNGTASPGTAPGTVDYTPGPGFSGIDTFSYDVADNQSARTNPALVTVTVNDSPITAPDSALTNEATPVTVDVLANDSDSDGTLDPTTVAVVTGPANGQTLVNAITGRIVYTPNAGFDGIDSFDYTVDDDRSATSLPATVTVTVNDSPVAVADSTVTALNTPVMVTVLANDSDSDGVLVPATVTVTVPATNGATAVDGAGVVTYTPTAGYQGMDSFGYRVQDDLGALSNAATVSITVGAQPPVPGDDAIRLVFGTTTTRLVGGSGSLLANDSDPNGDGLAVTTTPVTAPLHGALTLAGDGTFSYTHDGRANASDGFDYEVCDDSALALCATGSVTITAVPDLVFTNGFE